MTAIGCSELRHLVELYLDGDLSQLLSLVVQEHLLNCDECQAYAEQFTKVDQAVLSWGTAGVPAADPAYLKALAADLCQVKGPARSPVARSWLSAHSPSTADLAKASRTALRAAGSGLKWTGKALTWAGTTALRARPRRVHEQQQSAATSLGPAASSGPEARRSVSSKVSASIRHRATGTLSRIVRRRGVPALG